jgi:ferredoxin-NADP reductase
MTAQGLLLLILLGIAIQLAVYAGVAFIRYWLAYQRLETETSGQTSHPSWTEPLVEASPPAWQGYREFRVTRREYANPIRDVCSFHLAPVDGKPLPPFKPGQFLTFQIQRAEASAPLIRCYSLSSAPQPDHYRVSIKRVPQGVASNHFHDQVREGDVLALRAPGGHFHLDVERDDPVVLIAGGIGITPLFSMVSAALAARPGREIHLFYGVRNGAEVAFRAPLEALAQAHPSLHLHFCYSRPAPEETLGRDYHHAGRVDIERLRLSLDLRPWQFYLCGPGPMMETLVPALEDWGVPPARLHYEAFGPATVARRGSAAGPALGVAFSRSGRRLEWTSGSLLELAESQGLRVESGCRSGCCGACQTAIESGEVAYDQAPEFNVEPGHCLLCMARPKTDLILTA